jgi:hypothetical protein
MPRADEAVAGFAEIIGGAPGASASADDVVAGAREARRRLLVSAGLAH